ncbi:hypothetical protein SCARD494_00452 [Seiridium cardinale]
MLGCDSSFPSTHEAKICGAGPTVDVSSPLAATEVKVASASGDGGAVVSVAGGGEDAAEVLVTGSGVGEGAGGAVVMGSREGGGAASDVTVDHIVVPDVGIGQG